MTAIGLYIWDQGCAEFLVKLLICRLRDSLFLSWGLWPPMKYNFVVEASPCACFFSCIKQHGLDGCTRCEEFLDKYFPHDQKLKVRKSVAIELKQAIEELFDALGLDRILMEGELAVTTSSFAKDFIKLIDEVKDERDIMELWHIEFSLAQELFLLFKEVVYGDKGDGDEETSDDIEAVSESDETDSFDLDTDNEFE